MASRRSPRPATAGPAYRPPGPQPRRPAQLFAPWRYHAFVTDRICHSRRAGRQPPPPRRACSTPSRTTSPSRPAARQPAADGHWGHNRTFLRSRAPLTYLSVTLSVTDPVGHAAERPGHQRPEAGPAACCCRGPPGWTTRVTRLPTGPNTLVGHRGTLPVRGEPQRLAVTHTPATTPALPPDQATSQPDAISSATAQRRLRQ